MDGPSGAEVSVLRLEAHLRQMRHMLQLLAVVSLGGPSLALSGLLAVNHTVLSFALAERLRDRGPRP